MLTFKEFLLEEIKAEDLTNVYELNYMYDMMKLSNFTGLPQRRDNLIRDIEDKGIDLCDDVLTQLNDIFYNWLEQHALLSAKSWAESRTKEFEEGGQLDYNYIFIIPFDEYARYKYPNIKNPPAISYNFKGQITSIPKEVGEMVDEYLSYIQEHDLYKDCALSDWFDLKILQFKDDWETELSGTDDEDESKSIIDNMRRVDERDYSLLFDIEFVTMENMIVGLEDGLIDEIDLLTDIYEYVIFPLWFGYWEERGIVQTRENINNIRENMLKALHKGDLSEKFKMINIALNAMHQTGAMLTYIENEHNEISKQLLDELSNMNVDKLNKKLKMQGFQVDKLQKWNPFKENLTTDDVKLKSVETQVKSKQMDVDNKTKEKERYEKEIQNISSRDKKTDSDFNRLERLRKQIKDLDVKIKNNIDQMNRIYNTYTKSKTSLAPILGKTLGAIDNISQQKEDDRDYYKEDVNYKNRQLGFNFSTGGSDIDRVNKGIEYEKQAIESHIRAKENENNELNKNIKEMEKEIRKAEKQIDIIGDPNDVGYHSNEDYVRRNKTIRGEKLRNAKFIVDKNPKKIEDAKNTIIQNNKEIEKLKKEIENIPKN